MSRTERDARRVALEALLEFELQGIDGRLGELLDTSGLEQRDAALARELCFGVTRRRRLIDFVMASLVTRGLPSNLRILTVLRLGIYQLLFMDRIPVHAAVHASVALAGSRRAFANAVLRSLTRQLQSRPADPLRRRNELALSAERCLVLSEAEFPDPETESAAHHALLQSLPDYLVARWERCYGPQKAAEIAAASSRQPVVFLRRSGRCDTLSSLADALLQEGVQTEASEHREILRWSGGSSPFSTRAFHQGLFVAQDPTALSAAEALGAKPGESVLDLCAAPGIKASYLADAVGASGRVYAFDPDPQRRPLISANAERLGLTQIECIDSLKGIGKVDRVLIDVPCSNTGVLARRVEVRNRLSEEIIASLARKQARILAEGWEHLLPSGVCVYSTCSIETEENQAVVKAFAAERELQIKEMTTTLPAVPLHDGGFHAVLVSRPARH